MPTRFLTLAAGLIVGALGFWSIYLGAQVKDFPPTKSSASPEGGVVGTPATREGSQKPEPAQRDAGRSEALGRLDVVVLAGGSPLPATTASRVVASTSALQAEGVFHFEKYPILDYKTLAFRPLAGFENRELRFKFGNETTFDVPGDYIVLPSHAVYSMYDLALRKKDADAAQALERILGQVAPKGVAIYTWASRSPEFVVFDDLEALYTAKAKYKGTISFVKESGGLQNRLNELVAGYFLVNSAKNAATPEDRRKLKGLATRVLPETVVNQLVPER